MEIISDGIIEKKTAVANNLCTAAVKGIRITFKQMKNVEMRAHHKHHKKYVYFQKLKDNVWETFRVGITTTIMVFAENIYIRAVRETKTDS